MDRKICFFIGHRDTPDAIYPALLAQVERHITELGAKKLPSAELPGLISREILLRGVSLFIRFAG